MFLFELFFFITWGFWAEGNCEDVTGWDGEVFTQCQPPSDWVHPRGR